MDKSAPLNEWMPLLVRVPIVHVNHSGQNRLGQRGLVVQEMATELFPAQVAPVVRDQRQEARSKVLMYQQRVAKWAT